MIYASIKIKMMSLHLLAELKEAYQPHGKFMIHVHPYPKNVLVVYKPGGMLPCKLYSLQSAERLSLNVIGNKILLIKLTHWYMFS